MKKNNEYNKKINYSNIIKELFAKAENIEEVDAILSNQNIPISIVDENNNTLLHYVLKNTKNVNNKVINIVKYYIDANIPLNHKNNYNEYILHLALKLGNHEIIDMLINNNNNNINFFVKDQYNNYPIHYVYGKYKTCVKLNNKFILQLLDFKKSRVYNDERNNTIPNISNNDVLTIKDIEDIYQGIAPEILNQTNTTIISNNRYLKNDNNDYNYDLNNLYLRIKWDLNSF